MDSSNVIVTLNNELDWLQLVMEQSVRSYLMQEGHENDWKDIPLPNLKLENTPYAIFVREMELDLLERMLLALVLVPYLRPELLDLFFGKNQMYDRAFTEFGGALDRMYSGFLPTGQTFLFLASATDQSLKEKAISMLGPESRLIKEQIVVLSDTERYLPPFSGFLSLNTSWFYYFLNGHPPETENSSAFPAKRITTHLNWEKAVLDETVTEQIDEIMAWIKHGNVLLNEWGLSRHLKPGYRALFYGPPGTGKTLTATLLGKSTGKPVYRVDLSMIVSKYIGETEKNLARLFDVAQFKDWILFFDEADALFGKRTSANSSNDRHANQQTAYLLQRIEDFPGVVILASNLKSNMDEAFSRRFQSVVYFGIPSVEERYSLWKNAFSGVCKLDSSVNLYQIAEEFTLSGGSIINVLRYCALTCVRSGINVVTNKILLSGIRREYKRENKTMDPFKV